MALGGKPVNAKSPISNGIPSPSSSLTSVSTGGSYGSTSDVVDKNANSSAPLVSASKHLLRPNGMILGREVGMEILPKFKDLLSSIPRESHRQALASIDGRDAISHRRIYDFLVHIGHVFHTSLHVGRGHRIAVVLPNGSELALAILAVTCWASCVPLNANAAAAELQSDLEKSGADCIIALDPEKTGTGAAGAEIRRLAAQLEIPFCGLVPDHEHAGLFSLIPPQFSEKGRRNDGLIRMRRADPIGPLRQPNLHDDEVLVLFTSGTTGSKKLVPHLLSDVLIATACISVSWDLTPADTNCNLMPLFHVGGIIRQVFSPVLSGGCVICCPSFDPLTFWHLLMKTTTISSKYPKFTWYYAAPTMHQLILQTGRAEGHIPEYDSTKEGMFPSHLSSSSPNTPRLRMIANAAGGLLPSLARELRQAFGANVLPSYGMTECMPITSPPANYQLEKPGTSGVAVGPELAILNKFTLEPLAPGQEGPICVKHEPCFRGYGMIFDPSCSVSASTSPVTFIPTQTGESSGWFDTGDLGYMDEDGYLFITGRSKEVINRGGEIISPMEVEEAVVSHPDVEACAAFSAPHDVLQEVVGIVVVMKQGRPRFDLPKLHSFLGDGRLAAPKWPQCLIFMNGGLPKSFTNKILRVNLEKRMNLPELSDKMHPIERTFEALCPPQGTEISVPISCHRVSCNASQVQDILRQEVNGYDSSNQTLIVRNNPLRAGALVAYVCNLDRIHVLEVAQSKLDAYAIPTHICSLVAPVVDLLDDDFFPLPQTSDAIGSILQEAAASNNGPVDPIVTEVQELMQAMLDLDCLPPPDTSFFNVGGSSMLASQLAAKIRKIYNISFGGAEVFHHSSCQDIAAVIHERRAESKSSSTTTNAFTGNGNSNTDSSKQWDCLGSSMSKKLNENKLPFASTRMDIDPGYVATMFQLVPLVIIYPIWQLTRIYLFFQCLLFFLNEVPGPKNILKFIMTLFVFHLVWVTLSPLLFIVVKWIVIGKYEKGRYPLWGSYYLRWWFVEVMRKMIGRGLWGSNEYTLNLYYRLLGAKIGKGARISPQCDLAEYDLVTIGAGAAIELSTVRAFGIDNGCMILGPVGVGDNSSVGVRSVVAPYTQIPNNCHLAPAASSYDIGDSCIDGDSDKHLRYNRQALPRPSFLSQAFVISPIVLLANWFSHIPSLFVLFWMLHQPWNYDYPFQNIGHMMQWFCEPRRIPFFIGIRVARALLAPHFFMFFSLCVKWCIIGKFRPGPRNTRSEWQLIRHALAAQLFTRESIQQVTELVGRHYELVSVLYRLLGAKVGKRVFWPGRQPVFTGEFDLLEIGDDVVFGSRSTILCTTMNSAEKVILCAGCNVSDNTVVLPGSIVGKLAVLGSNAVCPAGRYLPEGSLWFGARGGEPVLLGKGVEDFDGPVVYSYDIDHSELQMKGDHTTLKPFGKAFYYGEASYYVYPLSFLVVFTAITRVLVATVSAISLIGAVHGTAGYFYGWPIYERDYFYIYVPFPLLYSVMVSYFILTHSIHILFWITCEFVCKWVIIGQRKEGRYNYDVSSYCQNWELYQITSKFRELGRMNFLDFICGTPYMTTYFRMLGGTIGENCCLYPAGGDPYMPEPDLVEMGDRCVIDCASVVCHLNTNGNFELVKITMENNVTLRTRARIQQGVYMESGSMLLEKCLAMTGEVIDADSVWMGAPASRLLSYDDTMSVTTSSSSSLGFVNEFTKLV